MTRLVECVPNFSEGRRPEVVKAIVAAMAAVEGVKVLDYSSDASHNRSVVTVIGEPEAVCRGALAGVAKAAELIDMEQHHGAHPRIGAADVVPLVPVSGVTMEECVALARRLGEKIGEMGIPVYLYEEAATRPERKSLPEVRRGEYEGLKEAIKTPERRPDFGPARLHPTAGATAVGARPPLIAYNINLNTSDVTIAKQIARSIRGRNGGYPSIKALGVLIAETNQAQVTINVCNFRQVSLPRVLETVRREAARYGVAVVSSEIVGLLPLEAMIDAAAYYLQLQGFQADQILEKKIADLTEEE